MAEKVAASLATVRKAVSAIVSPDLSEIKTELKLVKGKIEATNSKIDEMDKRLTGRIDEMDKRLTGGIESLRHELRAEIKSVDTKVGEIDKKLDIDRRMLVMETRMKELEKRS